MTYCDNCGESRPTNTMHHIDRLPVAVDGFDITEGERAVVIGKHPTDPRGADGRGAWSLNTSPVVWATTYTLVA